ncbi:unannotated protein [freshwater metagenome]|uniref:Unannotated protein n=1 Tax=freshwater metagenome TaxID=449393 RepID=A0A6J7HLP6_9ZZZZ|nr:NAD(P)-binding protein [Actinomycetota bacterium]
MAKAFDFIVIGGGLAGLNAALTLQKNDVDVLVLESSDRPGGRVASDLIDGYTCDRGFQLINSKYPSLAELDVIREIDFISAPRVIEVCIDDQRHAIGDPRVAPFSVLNQATGSIPEKIRFLAKIFVKPQKEQSIAQILRELGSTYERVLRPFLYGVFLTDPELVDARYALSIIRSFINGDPGLPRHGVGALPKALAKRVNQIELNTRVDRIDGLVVETSTGEFRAKKIIVATDSATAAQLLDFKEGTPMAGCITWYHATSENPSGNGRLVVDGQRRGAVINSVVVSDISSTYAPAGKHLVSTTTSLGSTESDVRRHLSLIWGVDTRDWDLIAKYEIPAALPVHNIGKSLSQPLKISESIFVAGDHRTVPSQQGALFSGKLAAELALN